jgi:PhnB protein
MEDNSIPTSIAPWLSVPDCAKAVDFYKSAFDATEVYRLQMPDGAIVVARLSVNGAEFWLGEETIERSNNESVPVRMILTVSNPDSFFANALEAGATQIFPVGEEHGWRMGRLTDPFGNHWEIGRPVEE